MANESSPIVIACETCIILCIIPVIAFNSVQHRLKRSTLLFVGRVIKDILVIISCLAIFVTMMAMGHVAYPHSYMALAAAINGLMNTVGSLRVYKSFVRERSPGLPLPLPTQMLMPMPMPQELALPIIQRPGHTMISAPDTDIDLISVNRQKPENTCSPYLSLYNCMKKQITTIDGNEQMVRVSEWVLHVLAANRQLIEFTHPGPFVRTTSDGYLIRRAAINAFFKLLGCDNY